MISTSRRRPNQQIAIRGVDISHPEKIVWPAFDRGQAISKATLAGYVEAVGPWLLEHVKGRPCSLVRAPEGIDGPLFYQRHAMPGVSRLITQIKVRGDRKPYVQFDTLDALIAAAQIGAVEFHPWNCQPGMPETPGRLVFDLDPATGVPFAKVIAGAIEIRDRLSEVGLVGFCKTTGGKGLHVVTPLKRARARDVAWPLAKSFALELCRQMAADSPDNYLVNMSKKARSDKIFLDYLRNDRTATAVAPLSPRARPGAPVSMPLTWSQVRAGLDPMRYTLSATPGLLSKSRAWEGYCDAERPLPPAAKKLAGRGQA